MCCHDVHNDDTHLENVQLAYVWSNVILCDLHVAVIHLVSLTLSGQNTKHIIYLDCLVYIVKQFKQNALYAVNFVIQIKLQLATWWLSRPI